jgi:penicillin amidase
VSISVALLAWSVACGGASGPAAAPPPLPQVTGTLPVAGLSAPVRVVRDRWGVPHIRAASQQDLFFAQGFVQAQDRLFQMDLWRRAVQGRLSEVLGSNFIERDAMTRNVQYRGAPDEEWASYGPDARAIAAAFVAGVNAWVEIARADLPEEFIVAGWLPEAWRPEDLLNRTDAFLAAGDAQTEIVRARLVAARGPAAADYLPAAGGDAAAVPRALDMATVSPVVADALRRVGTAPFFSGLAALPVDDRPAAAAPQRGVGSNAWAVAGRRTASGAPLLAADPHRPLGNPSLRYVVHLQGAGWNAIGATAPWLPGVAIGHNERIAWAMTAAPSDTQDLFVERVNPADERQVSSGDQWVAMTAETDTLAVKGWEEPFEFERLSTPRGLVVAVDRERHLAYTLRWSGTTPGTAAELGALAIGRATTWEAFRAAAERWKTPVVEFVYADMDGRIARQTAGLLPLRQAGHGALPAPGWTGEYGWRGTRRFDTLPRDVDPASGFVVSADDGGPRFHRISEVLAELPAADVASFQALQHDTVSWGASRLVPLLDGVRAGRADVEEVRRRLLQWDFRMTADGPEASMYARWERELARGLAEVRVPADLLDEYLSRAGIRVAQTLTGPLPSWLGAERRDALLLEALTRAVDTRLDTGEGPLVTFHHPLGISQRSRSRFAVGPFSVPGYEDTVLAISRGALGRTIGPSFRLIADLGDWDRSVATSPPGQSGSPGSPHFDDLAGAWARGEYFPLAFSDAAVERYAESTLVLLPPQGDAPAGR